MSFKKPSINSSLYLSKPASKGLVKKINILIKNVTTDGEKTNEYSNDFRSQNFGSILYDLSFPMKKVGSKYDSFLSGKASFMYSPNKNKNIKDLDRKIDITNIFSQNRLGLSNSVEGGQSVTLGADYEIIDKNNIKLVVWERGAGITKACGTAACAAAYSAMKLGLSSDNLNISLPGGTLEINIDSEGNIHKTGPVELEYSSSIAIEGLYE